MKIPVLKVAGLIMCLISLAGCSASAPKESTEKSFYSSCDTGEPQPLTALQDRDWKTYWVSCPTDREVPEPALPEATRNYDVDACRLNEKSKERSRYNDSVTGFPRSGNKHKLPNGHYRISVIPVEWPDLEGEDDIFSSLEEAIYKVDAWYSIYSRGKVSFEWYLHRDWVTLPDSSRNYFQSENQQNTDQWGDDNRKIISKFWKTSLGAADPKVDFTGTDIVFFVLPTQQDLVSEFNLWPPGTGTFQTDEGAISRGFTPGNFHFRDGNAVWMFWIHEMLHYFKLPDLYWVDQNSVKHSEFTMPGPIQEFDILSNQSGAMKSLNGWLMWLADWSNRGELVCVTEETFTSSSFRIYPNHLVDNSLKSVVLKLSDTSAVVIESRRSNEFDPLSLSRSREGVLVYHVDTRFGNGEGALTVLAPAGRTLINLQSEQQSFISLDAILYEGNSIDIAGYHIVVNKADAKGDIVSVSKAKNFTPGEPGNYVCFTKSNRDLKKELSITCPIVY